MTSEAFRANAVREFDEALREMIAHREFTDFSPAGVQVAVHAAADAVKRVAEIRDRLGVFYRIDRVRSLLGGISRQAVSDRVRHHRMLRVRTSDGEFVFPGFQFAASGGLVPGIADLLQVLLGGGDPWTVTYWLTATVEELRQSTPLEVLASGDAEQIDALYALARRDAAGWATVA